MLTRSDFIRRKKVRDIHKKSRNQGKIRDEGGRKWKRTNHERQSITRKLRGWKGSNSQDLQFGGINSNKLKKVPSHLLRFHILSKFVRFCSEVDKNFF